MNDISITKNYNNHVSRKNLKILNSVNDFENEPLRTGDILYYTNIFFSDILTTLSEVTEIGHMTLIFVGKEYESLSACGKSPSNTYVLKNLFMFVPLEEELCLFWKAKNISRLLFIRRISGSDISFDKAIDAFHLTASHFSINPKKSRLAFLYSWLKLYDNTNNKSLNTNIRVCSEFIINFYKLVGFVPMEYHSSNAIPDVIIKLEFPTNEYFFHDIIFDKDRISKKNFVRSFTNIVDGSKSYFYCPRYVNLIGNYKRKIRGPNQLENCYTLGKWLLFTHTQKLIS